MDNKILELCKSVVDTSLDELRLYGAKCGEHNVRCLECPFCRENRNDRVNCYEDANKIQEIARRYVNNKKESDNVNNKKMKIIDIFNNWDNFKVGTEFYDEDIKDVVFSKNGCDDVVLEDYVYIFRLDYELIVKEPINIQGGGDIMNNKERILKLCEEVVKNGSNFGVNCDGIYCDDCPLCGKNREDGEGCVDNDEETVKIAKEYIDKNKVYYKVK